MAVYDEFIDALEIAWNAANVRYRGSQRAIKASRNMIRFVAPVDFDNATDPLPDLWQAVYKTWVKRWKAGYLKCDSYAKLVAENARLNTAARGLVQADEMLSGKNVKLAKKEVFERSVHGALEAHHIIEKGWIFRPDGKISCPKMHKYFSERGGADGMPAINLTQFQHRGNALSIGGMARGDLGDLGLEYSKESVTAVLNREIRSVKDDADLLTQLHKVYSEKFPKLYKSGIELELNRIAVEISKIP